MDEQRKFKYLKSRLESLNYKQPFTIDSAGLIETLLNDISNLNQRLRSLKSDPETIRELSGRIEYLNREKIRLEDEIQSGEYNIDIENNETMSQTVSRLKRENQSLNQRLSGTVSLKREDLNDKSREYIDKLFLDCTHLRKQLEEADEKYQKLLFDNRNLHEKLNSYELEISHLKKEIEISGFTIKEINDEKKVTTEDYYVLRNKIASYESRYSILQNEFDSLKTDNQKLQLYNKNLEHQVTGVNKEFNKNRNDLDLISSSNARLNSKLESLQRQLDVLQTENNKLHSLRDQEKENASELEEKFKDLEKSYKNSQDKIRTMQKETQGLCDTIQEKVEEIKNKDLVRKNLEKDLKSVTLRYEESYQECKKLKNHLDEINAELKKTAKDLEDRDLEIQYKEDNNRVYKNYLEQANKEIENYKHSVEDFTIKLEGYSQSLRNNAMLEDQLKSMKAQFEDSVKRERQLYSEIEKVTLMLQKSEDKYSISSKHIDSLQNQKQTLEHETNKLQKSLSELVSKDNSKALELARLDSRLQKASEELEDYKRRLSKTYEDIASLQEELRDTKSAYNSEKIHNSRQSDQLSQLKDYIKSLELSKSDYEKKLETFQMLDIEKENSLKRYKEEMLQLKKQISVTEINLTENISYKESLLKQIDALKYDISRKNDENLNLKNSLKRFMSDLEDVKLKTKAIQDSEENYKKNWRDSEIEKSRLTEINLSINLQLEDSKKTLNRLQIQLQEFSSDKKTLENNIQRLEDHSKTLGYERDTLGNKYDQLTQDLRSKIETIAVLSREKEELSQKIRLKAEDYDEISRAYDYLNLDYKKLSNKLSAIENSNENLKKQEEVYIRSIKQLEEENRTSNRLVEMNEYKRIEAEKAAESLLKEFHSAKTLTREIDNTREDLHRRLNSVDNERQFLDTKCRSLENELNNARSQLEYEKSRSMDLETKFIREKENVKRYELEEDRTRSLNQSHHDIVSELYKQIETYKSESLKLEIAYMKLMEEHNQTKHSLHRAQTRLSELELRR
jgi:chromosome segregation ATPase